MAPLREVTVNGKAHAAFAAASGDVDVTAAAATPVIHASFLSGNIGRDFRSG